MTIQFTMEVKKQISLPFLYVNVERDNNNWRFTVHRKETYRPILTCTIQLLSEDYDWYCERHDRESERFIHNRIRFKGSTTKNR